MTTDMPYPETRKVCTVDGRDCTFSADGHTPTRIELVVAWHSVEHTPRQSFETISRLMVKAAELVEAMELAPPEDSCRDAVEYAYGMCPPLPPNIVRGAVPVYRSIDSGPFRKVSGPDDAPDQLQRDETLVKKPDGTWAIIPRVSGESG